MSVIIGFVLERQPCLSEWQVAESFPVTPNDSDQEYALNITPKLYWPDSTTLQYNSIDTALAQKTCTKLAAFQINIEKIHCVAWIAFRTSSAPAEIPIWKTEFGWTGSFGMWAQGIPFRYHESSIWNRGPMTGLVGKSASRSWVGRQTGCTIPRNIASLKKWLRTSLCRTPLPIIGELASVKAAWLSFSNIVGLLMSQWKKSPTPRA